MTIRSTSRLFASSALLAALSFTLLADAKLSKTGGASASFLAKGPAGMDITGRTSDVTLADDGTTVTVTVKLDSLDTGMSLRDKHTKDALETTTYPTAEIKVARSALKFPAAGAESSGDAKGSLKIHGQSKDVSFHYTAKMDGDTLGVKGSANINMSDFGIKPPSYLGVTVKDAVSISVGFSAKDN